MSKYPILFEANETEFKTHGIGVLSDAVQCDVTEEINGIFELNMVYPSSGKYLKELKNNRLIYADASKELGDQPFRICRVTKLLNGLVNVYAQHISYDLGGIQLPPFETLGTIDGLEKVKTYSTTKNDYDFSTTVISDEDNTFSIETPKSVRAYLLGDKDSFLQAYGGEFTFDRFNVRHSTLRGSDKGFRVKYGVNLVDLNQEESIEKTYTGIFPYYKSEYMFMDLTESYDPMYPHEVDTSKLSGKIMYADGTFAHNKIANVDLSPYFEVDPFSTDELKEVAEQYMKDNSIGVPTVSLDVHFESLRNSPEYSNVIFLEDVFLGDTIHVDFAKLGVSATGSINTIIYDSLRHKNKRVSVGDPKNNVADMLVSITNSVKGAETSILGSSRSIAKIDLLTNQNAASITALTSRVTETEENIGSLEISVDGHRSELEAIAKWQDDTDASLASIEATAEDNEAKIGLLVETSESGENAVIGSILVEAINGQSEATIAADKVNLTGYVTVTSLKNGTTTIDGAAIKTGSISSTNYLRDYKFLYEAGLLGLAPGKYYVIEQYATQEMGLSSSYLDPVYYHFETTTTLPKNGSIKYSFAEKKIVAFDADGTIIETIDVVVDRYALDGYTELDISNDVYYSDDGTSYDLESGEITSAAFRLKTSGLAMFRLGIHSTLYNLIGGFLFYPRINGSDTGEIRPAGKKGTFMSAYGDVDGGISIKEDALMFNTRKDTSSDKYIKLYMSTSSENDNKSSYNATDDIFYLENYGGSRMEMTPSAATITGWKAIPYTADGDASEIVTKQDLINLGLIS